MQNPLTQLFEHKKMIVVDGPLATELEARGHCLNDHLWSARLLESHPAEIEDVHLRYFQAGADVAITASYQASVEGFTKAGKSVAQAQALIVRAAELARNARAQYMAETMGPPPLIAGSIGSYGAFLADGSEYRGNFSLSTQELIDFHRPRMSLLADHVDLFAFETIPCWREARALCELLKEFPQHGAWLCFSAGNGQQTCEGDAISEIAHWVEEQGQIWAVGINCSHPRLISQLLEALGSGTRKPLIVYPNSGEAYDANNGDWRGEGMGFCQQATLDHWYALGARLIGGCCRTTPEMIAAINQWRNTL